MLTYSTLKVYSLRQSHEFCTQQQIISRQNNMGNYLTTCKVEYHKLSRPSIAQVSYAWVKYYVALTMSDILSQMFDNVFIIIILPLVHVDISMVIVMLCSLRWCAITLCNMEKYHHRKWIKLQIVYISMGIELASNLGIL